MIRNVSIGVELLYHSAYVKASTFSDCKKPAAESPAAGMRLVHDRVHPHALLKQNRSDQDLDTLDKKTA